MFDIAPHKFVAGWILIYLVLFGFTLNNSMPYQGDESFYIGAGINMVKTQNYFLPVYSGKFRFQKPLLPYWLTVLGYKTFGINLWSGRLPFLLFSGALLVLLYRFARLISPDPQYAGLNVVLLSSSLLFLQAARISMTDMLFAFFTTLALYAFYRALDAPAYITRYYGLAYAAMGLAFASKGFLGVVPALAMFGYVLWVKPQQHKKYILMLFNPLYLALIVIPALAWYGYLFINHHDELLCQLHKETASSITSGFPPIGKNILFYGQIMCTYYLPFTALAAYLVIKKKIALPRRFILMMLSIGITFFILLVIIIIKRPKDRYLLVIWPTITIIVGYVLHQARLTSISKKIAVILALLQIGVFLAYPLVSGQPINRLIDHWENHLQGELAAYNLSDREMSWAQALSHGTILPYDAKQPYVLLKDDDLAHFERYEIISQATNLSKLSWKNGKIVTHHHTYLLIHPSGETESTGTRMNSTPKG
jgi:4-amino-4-deoxy-L-arabinose transferase-like glycosyltransferase